MLDHLLGSVRRRIRSIAHNNRRVSTGARYDTSDIVQESMIQIWKEMQGRTDNPAVSQAWLITVAKGHAAKLNRFHSSALRTTSQETHCDIDAAAYDESRKKGSDPEERELQLLILTAIDDLPQVEKDIIYRHFFEDEGLASIARQMEITVDTARGHRERALRALRRALGQLLS